MYNAIDVIFAGNTLTCNLVLTNCWKFTSVCAYIFLEPRASDDTNNNAAYFTKAATPVSLHPVPFLANELFLKHDCPENVKVSLV